MLLGVREAGQAGIGDDDRIMVGEVGQRIAIQPGRSINEYVHAAAAAEEVATESADYPIVAEQSPNRVGVGRTPQRVDAITTDDHQSIADGASIDIHALGECASRRAQIEATANFDSIDSHVAGGQHQRISDPGAET